MSALFIDRRSTSAPHFWFIHHDHVSVTDKSLQGLSACSAPVTTHLPQVSGNTPLRKGRSLLNHIRQFYRIKASDDIRSALARPVTAHCRVKRIAKVCYLTCTTPFGLIKEIQDIRRIKAATSGSNKAFAHILDVAYGRKGKLRWELMEVCSYDTIVLR